MKKNPFMAKIKAHTQTYTHTHTNLTHTHKSHTYAHNNTECTIHSICKKNTLRQNLIIDFWFKLNTFSMI